MGGPNEIAVSPFSKGDTAAYRAAGWHLVGLKGAISMRFGAFLTVLLLIGGTTSADRPDPIESVQVSADRGWRINGRPFFPIMGWLQGARNLPKLSSIGCNTIAGFHRPGRAPGAILEYAEAAGAAGLYFTPPFEPSHMAEMEALKTQHARNLLAWMHADEPDLPKKFSDAKVTPGGTLIINPSRPLYLMFDGDLKTSAILDPIQGGSFSIAIPENTMIKTIGIANVPGEAVAREVRVLLDNVELMTVSLNAQKSLQTFDLSKPASGRQLSVRIDSADGAGKYGAIAEVQALDETGKNLLQAPVQQAPNMTTEQVQTVYETAKRFDPSRPMLLTTTPFFLKGFENFWSREVSDRMYPALIKSADVIGYDHYPLYGWNNPKFIPDVSRGMVELKAYGAAGKPMYQWIETKAGGKFGARAKPVTEVEIRNEVWQAIIHGATAIGYFTHEFTPFSEFAGPPDNQKAILAQIAQMVKLNRQSKDNGDVAYNFTHGSKIDRIYVSAAVQAHLMAGRLVIVCLAGATELVPRVIADKIAERDASLVVRVKKVSNEVDEDDPYAAFQIPDDLMW